MYDLVLIHPPSVYNFREKKRDYGPVSDMVPSTPVFEMFPIGFLSMVSYLCPQGYRVKVENIALEMLRKRNFDVKKRIESLDTAVFGIDLHWLPHVHGALSLARTIKEIFPDVPVVMGGLSSTYFKDEIMREHPYVDGVMTGDTTEPFMGKMLDAFEGKGKLDDVPNLVWRDNGRIRYNIFLPPEKYIDSVRLDYRIFTKNCIRDMELLPSLPYSDWIKSPAAMTFIQKGCHNNCLMCGGSNYSYKNFLGRKYVSLRPVRNVIDDLISIQETLGVPVYISGDIYQAGNKYREELIRSMREESIDLPILFELFYPAPKEFYEQLKKNVPRYAMEISPESSVENIRISNNKFYTNFALEKNIEYAMRNDAVKMDIFFSIGLSRQDRGDVYADYFYAKRVQERFGKWLHFFISPIVPFVDPGSIAFEECDSHGFKIFARTLKQHYILLENSSNWVDSLNYETFWLKRGEIGELSREMSTLFSSLREDYGKNNLYWAKHRGLKFPLNIVFGLYGKFIRI